MRPTKDLLGNIFVTKSPKCATITTKVQVFHYNEISPKLPNCVTKENVKKISFYRF